MQEEVFREQERDITDYLNILGRHKGLIATVMTVILIVSLGLALGLPAVYKSSATILIEQQEVPQEFVRTLVTSFAEQRIQLISHKVLSTKNLIQLIEKYDLYRDDRKVKPVEIVVEKMREDISLDMISADVVDPKSGLARSATIAFSLSFEEKSPKLTQSIVNELVTLFLNQNIKDRTQTSIQASNFLTQEADKLRKTISTLERKLADFKEKNRYTLPELSELNTQLMTRTESELREVKRSLDQLGERKIYLTAELSQQRRTVDEQRVNPNYRGNTAIDPESRLDALQTEYLAAVSKYSSDHPDVSRLKREISSLRDETGLSQGNTGDIQDRIDELRLNLNSARERYSPEHPDVRRYSRELQALEKEKNDSVVNFGGRDGSPRPYYIREVPNPAYVQLKSQLDAAELETASLQEKVVELENKLNEYEERLTRTPQVERVYKDLTRDFETATLKYRDITAKQLEAQLSQSLESERKGERFTLIEPPILPEEPFKPNRLAIAFLGLVFAFAGGIGSAALAEAMNDSVRGRHGVLDMLGESPLAIIPYINTEEDRKKQVMHRSLIIFGAVSSVFIAAIVVHFYFLPLDVFWFRSLRKVGL